MKKRIIIISMTGILLAVGLGLAALRWMGIQEKKAEEGTYVEHSDSVPYAYTVYGDHVVLEKYMGTETEVEVPEEVEGKPVTEIGEACFHSYEGLIRITLHEYIITINKYAFFGCTNLREVLQCGQVKIFGLCCFDKCEALETVEWGEDVEIISTSAFYSCKALRRLTPQQRLAVIDDIAFYDSGLEEFQFNEDVQMGYGAFTGTPWLQNQGKDFIVYGDGELFAYTGTEKKVSVPEGVKTLATYSFDGTTAEEVYLPGTVTAIQALAFQCCENVDIYIPDSVTEMGYRNESWTIIDKDTTSNITIYTTKGSYAEQYAYEHDLSYVIVEPW